MNTTAIALVIVNNSEDTRAADKSWTYTCVYGTCIRSVYIDIAQPARRSRVSLVLDPALVFHHHYCIAHIAAA